LNSQRLLHRVGPFEYEDAFGFLSRVATANHLKDAYQIIGHCTGNSAGTIKYKDMSKLAYFCLNTTSEISQLSGIELVRAEGNRIWQVNGEQISKAAFLCSRTARVCPQCLADQAYIRGHWSLTLYTVCALHKIKMIDECPACLKKIKWDRPSVLHCLCGTDLSLATTEKGGAPELLLSHLIARKVEVHHSPTRSALLNHQQIKQLSELSLDSLCKAIWFLGHCIGNLGKHGSGHGSKILSLSEANTVISQAFELLQSWPKKLGARLGELSTRQPTNSTDSLINKLFGPAQYYLHEALQSEELHFIRTAYKQYITHIWKDCYPQHIPIEDKTQLEFSWWLT
jgi:TniQ